MKLIEGGMFEHVGVLLNGSNGGRGYWGGRIGAVSAGRYGAGLRSSLVSRMDLTEP